MSFLDRVAGYGSGTRVVRANWAAARPRCSRQPSSPPGRPAYRVLTASGARDEAGIGLATLNQVLWPEHDALSALDRRDTAALASAFGHGPATTMDPDRLADAALAALDRPGSQSPVLIAVDDVQWADRISAAVLAALARAAVGWRLGRTRRFPLG